MALRIAVVSDLHCHHSALGYSDTLLLSDLPRKPENQHPVSALDLLIQSQGLQADILLMPGDMANRADPQGINSAWDYIGKINASLGSSVLASTLGNHDVIWKVPDDDSQKLARGLLPQFPTSSASQFHSFWSEGYYFEEKPDFRILVINSVKHQTNETSAKRGLISTLQLESIARYLENTPPKTFQIGLCHHHPIQHEEIDLGPNDLMENGSLLIELLSRFSFHLVVHGHKHHPRLKIDTSGGNPTAILAAGSFSAGMRSGLGTRTRNVFHIIDLRVTEEENPRCIGLIRTWQFQHNLGWTKATESASDFPHTTGFGSSDTSQVLVKKIEDAFHTHQKEAVRWSRIVEDVPDIQWVPPALFKAVGKTLIEHGFELSPAAPDLPNYIGIPV